MIKTPYKIHRPNIHKIKSCEVLLTSTWIASSVSVAFVTRQTGAASSVLFCDASSIYATIRRSACRCAFSINTSSVISALFVVHTFRQRWRRSDSSDTFTTYKRISSVSRWARANSGMSNTSAYSVYTASIDARIWAFPIDTSSISGAVVIHYALRVSTESVTTSTVRSTRVRVARIKHCRYRWRSI